MNKKERATIKVRILRLASLRSTGAPSDLAARFEIGVRSVKRLIKELREEGIEIRYSQIRRSYVTGFEYQ
jgi:biotin operon repressor